MLLNRQLVQNYKTNQLSNCKSLLALSSAYLMRSGQIGEIEVCIQLLFKKKKQLNVLKIVDCLRMIQDSFDDKSFKRIESVLNFKRKSLSVNFNLKNIAEALGKSVEHGGTFASLLVSVVM